MNNYAFKSSLNNFIDTPQVSIINQLISFVNNANQSQINAWKESIKILKSELSLLLKNTTINPDSTIILEYTIPLESRRIDALLLLNNDVIVIEFKGKQSPSQSDIDQASAYARDLRTYHSYCTSREVHCLLIPTQSKLSDDHYQNIKIIAPSNLNKNLSILINGNTSQINVDEFLSLDSYQPLPTLIKAARELFNSGSLKRIHRAASATEETLKQCSNIIHTTANSRRRSLILISGVPGAGKTLVGLQLAHAKYLDDLAIARKNGEKPNAAAVFLSGNGPLVEVLQYELRQAGGDGKAFVRGVHEYVKTFTRRADLIPPHHVLIYDEAQRAFDAPQVAAKHKDMPQEFNGLSEPELFIQFANRVPEWCVVVGLIGSGQEIHIGEEAGIGQWFSAIENSANKSDWDIYIPNNKPIISQFSTNKNTNTVDSLELSTTIRFHIATQLYDFVKCVLEGDSLEANRLSKILEANNYNLRITNNLLSAKNYLFDRYSENEEARFGIITSARDKELINHGIPKGFKNPNEVGPGKYGKWYSEPFGIDGAGSNLITVATEFAAQGLELDASLIAWGTDFIRANNQWTNKFASGYREAYRIIDALELRKNSYRVLLTRGRDCSLIYLPDILKLKETYNYLINCGFIEISTH